MHYYGYSLEDALSLPAKQYNILVKAMVINEARDYLVQMELELMPNYKDEDRKKIHKKKYKLAYPENFKNKIIKFGDLNKHFRV